MTMLEMFAKGGPLMWPILLCSLFALGMAVHKCIQFHWAMRAVDVPLSVALSRGRGPLAAVRAVLEDGGGEKEVAGAGTRAVRGLERGLGSLALVSSISPLLGLTGTVLGMIGAFRSLAASGAAANPELLASGIWEALLTTAAGLLVAIPAHVAHHYLDARLGEIVFTFQALSERMLEEWTRPEARRGPGLGGQGRSGQERRGAL
jgi:biopolymer transport protein ExbB